MNPILAASLASLLSAPLGFARGEQDAGHRKVYEKAAPSVVAIRALAPLGERSGTGVIISGDGLVLTSYAVCPEGASNIRVWVKGPRKYTAELVGTSKKDELALLRIRPKEELKPVEFGESAKVRVGQVSYTIGNAANSLIIDDQPSFNVGIVSGIYRLSEERANSTYVGTVIETTAAVNVGMEGAPCLDPDGRMIGFVTLNYSPHRFLGTAIPLDQLKPVIERIRQEKPAAAEEAAPEAAGEGYAGLKYRQEGAKIVVSEVDPEGPAARAGLQKGDVIVGVGSVKLKTAAELYERLKGLEAGSVVWFAVDLDGATDQVKVVLGKKK